MPVLSGACQLRPQTVRLCVQGVRESLEQAAVRQSKEEVGRLMNRCWAVDAAVSPRAPDPGVRESAQQEAAQYYEALEDADPVDPEDCPRDSPEHSRGAQGRQMVLHTNSKPARSCASSASCSPRCHLQALHNMSLVPYTTPRLKECFTLCLDCYILQHPATCW